MGVGTARAPTFRLQKATPCVRFIFVNRPRRYNQSALAVWRRSSPFPTLAEMAKQVGLGTPSALQQIETGRADASEDRLRSLAKALGLPQWRVEAAYLEARREFLRRQAKDVETRLREVLAKAS